MIGPGSARYRLKRTLRRAGLEVSRYLAFHQADERLRAVLGRLGIGMVIDVGANEGQFARQLRSLGYRGRILSFEPLAAAYQRLSAAAQDDPLWQVGPRVAIGERSGTLEMHVSRNSVSSSALPMLRTHLEAAPQSEVIAAERVGVVTLDEAVGTLSEAVPPVFVKIDVQGMEDKVLAGAVATLERAAAAQIELSLVPLYEGQPLMCEVIGLMRAAGFGLVDLYPGFIDPRDARVLQVDGVFVRDALGPA